MANPNPVQPAQGGDERTTAQLAGDLARQVTALVHHEIALAMEELRRKGQRAGLGGGMLGAAVLLSVAGGACITVCVIAALHIVLAVWLAALVVGCMYLMAGGALVLAGRREVLEASPAVPAETIESAKEDVQWIRSHTTSGKR